MLFGNDSSIIGLKLTEYLSWAHESFDPTGQSPPSRGVLALPPIQRSAAWNPRQVVDVWDSVLRGLPLGAFTLQERADCGLGHRLGANALNELISAGWDLLDGQQRTRSLLLGLYGPNLRDGRVDQRCLWIDLDQKSEQTLFALHLTSGSQPFGYEPSGYKLNHDARLTARRRFEPDGTEIRVHDRCAYSHELFRGFIAAPPTLRLEPVLAERVSDGEKSMPAEDYPKNWPPLPARVDLKCLNNGRTIMPLHLLLRAWTDAADFKEEALARLVSRDYARFQELCDALKHFDKAEIALVNASFVKSENLPVFYDRIGAGGTALSTEERLFSFYKAKRAAFHDIACEINERNGRVMVPSKIAASAIRIANAMAHEKRDQEKEPADPRPGEGNRSLTDVTQFAKMLEADSGAKDAVNLTASLDELVGIAADGTRTGGQFTKTFGALFTALKHDETINPLGLPTVLLWRLSPDLVQTLLFWMLHTKQEFDDNDNHLFCFIIFWRLCVRSDDKASNRCFRLIRETERCSLRSLYRAIRSDEALSRSLIAPEEMRDVLVRNVQPRWRSLLDRVEKKNPMFGELVDRWWHDGANILPWLQRNYLASAFPGYDPTADRDDDTPYDVNHMVPQSDWGSDWRILLPRVATTPFTPAESEKFRHIRHQLGNSIGNKWLVDYSTNRSWGNTSFETKLQHIEGESQDAPRRLLEVFPQDTRVTWIQASPAIPASPGNGGALFWNDQRLESFQYAVEHRAAWLYERLYEDLGFSAWEDLTPAS